MQFAVIRTGGKQYKVSEGDSLRIEKLSGDFKTGDKVVFDDVLAIDDGKSLNLGAPSISGKKVEATLETIGRAQKIDVIKYRAKSNYYKKRGHRQPFFKVKITKIA